MDKKESRAYSVLLCYGGCPVDVPNDKISNFPKFNDLQTTHRWFDPQLCQFFPMIDGSHCDRIHSFLTAVKCFNYGYVGKQPVEWKEFCAKYWLKEFQESMGRCTGRFDLAEKRNAENSVQHDNQLIIADVTNKT